LHAHEEAPHPPPPLYPAASWQDKTCHCPAGHAKSPRCAWAEKLDGEGEATSAHLPPGMLHGEVEKEDTPVRSVTYGSWDAGRVQEGKQNQIQDKLRAAQ